MNNTNFYSNGIKQWIHISLMACITNSAMLWKSMCMQPNRKINNKTNDRFYTHSYTYKQGHHQCMLLQKLFFIQNFFLLNYPSSSSPKKYVKTRFNISRYVNSAKVISFNFYWRYTFYSI